jgi:hypothetical protein
MSAALPVERQNDVPFVTDPEAVAASWYAHAKGSEERALQYRSWAAVSKTQIERRKWEAEAERAENQAAFAHAKHAEWLETVNG